jgi:hypothetical protein
LDHQTIDWFAGMYFTLAVAQHPSTFAHTAVFARGTNFQTAEHIATLDYSDHMGCYPFFTQDPYLHPKSSDKSYPLCARQSISFRSLKFPTKLQQAQGLLFYFNEASQVLDHF